MTLHNIYKTIVLQLDIIFLKMSHIRTNSLQQFLQTFFFITKIINSKLQQLIETQVSIYKTCTVFIHSTDREQ